MTALLDTGLLLAVLDRDDDLHQMATLALEEEPETILPDVVLPELGYLIQRELDTAVLAQFLRAVAGGELRIEYVQTADLARAADLLEKYADSGVDFVDCAIAAMAERLNITRVLTVDRRHFLLFRPRHCPSFEIAP